jgi:probable F420-dependent oxidoreductase
MKWGVVFASTGFPDPDSAVAMAQAAEEAGFESVWAAEHIVMSVAKGATPYRASEDGTLDRLSRRGGIPDPMVWLTYVAARTTTINLGTNVVVLPEHQPVVFAKTAATLDVLSSGRLILGIGVGELPEEYAAVGMEFKNRGKRMDEYIEAMRLLWTEDITNYAGEHVQLKNIRQEPRPVNGTVPLHIGGISKAAVSRAARSGDGYFPFVGFVDLGRDPNETLAEVIAAVRTEADQLGRDPNSIEMTIGGARTVDEAVRMKAIGADRLVIAVRSKGMDEVRDELATFGKEVIAATADL